MLLARSSLCEPLELVIVRKSAEAGRSSIAWSGSRRVKPWLSQDNSILTLITISLPLHSCSSVFLVLPAVVSLSFSVSLLSSTPLADSLTGFVPLANHSALIMRIISSHHSPPLCSFHLLWPVPSPSSTLHKPSYLRLCVNVVYVCCVSS